MKDEKRALLAGVISFAVLLGWFYFYGQKEMPKATPPSSAPAQVETGKVEKAQEAKSSEAAFSPQEEKETIRQTPLMTLEWTNRGGRLDKVLLKKFHETVSEDSPNINLLPFEGEKSLQLVCDGCNATLPTDEVFREVEAGDQKIVYEAQNDDLVVRKIYDWSEDQYLFQLKVEVENKKEKEFQGRLGLGWTAKQFPPAPKGKLGFLKGQSDNHRSFLYKLGQEVEHEKTNGDGIKEFRGVLPWAGIEDRYFLISLISRRVSSDQSLRLQQSGDVLGMTLFPGSVTIPTQGRYEESFSFYIGPKEHKHLAAANVGLEEAIDYGWFAILAIPILKLLEIFHRLTSNWGVAIILLTIFIKILMNPLTAKSMKQMKEMQKLQPRLVELKEKFKNDRQRLNMETMALFRTHKVNPMGGCFPMLLQMPIYIVLYKVLFNAIELYHAPFFGFYKDLSAPDPYFILPILLGIAMVAQQKLTPSPSADPMQKQMMMIMPIMFTAFMLFLPMGLNLYIFVNTVFGVAQQYLYQKGWTFTSLIRGKVALS